MTSIPVEKETTVRHSSSNEAMTFNKSEEGIDKEGSEVIEEKGEHDRQTIRDDNDLENGELERHLSRKSSKKVQIAPEKYPLTDLDKELVGWETQDDPTNPRNFAETRKWLTLTLVSAITFLSPLASAIFAPAIPFLDAEFGNKSAYLGALAISVFVLGFSVGPLFLSPLSEIYGRRIVLNISNVVFCAFTLGCALAPNLTGLIIMRLIAGIGGSACLTIASGIIADLFLPHQRGKAMAMYSLGVLFGPILGPIIGGFIAQRAGFRWVFYVVFITAVIFTAGLVIFLTETNPVVLIERKTRKLRKETGNSNLRNVYTAAKDPATLRRRYILSRGMYRPLKLLFTSPIVFLLSVYVAFIFGLLFLLFTTVTNVYVTQYGWKPELTGLAFLGVGLGNFCGILFVAKTSDATIIRLTKRNNGVYEPEMRLPTCVFFGFLIPISFFWYGWTADKHVHWVVPIIGLLPFGLGAMGIFAPIQTYLIDSFPQYAASAVSGLTALRCLFGAVLPLGAPKMYETLGLGWGNSLLGFIAIAMIPAPALIYKYGGYIRKRWPVEL